MTHLSGGAEDKDQRIALLEGAEPERKMRTTDEIKVGQCRVSIEPLVLIKIHGKPDPAGPPYVSDDGGLVREFLRFLSDSEINGKHLTTGGGNYTGIFTASSATEAEQWFREHEEAGHGPA